MKKIKILPSIIMLALCLAVLGIGVYSATTGSNTITGSLTVNSAGYEVEISVYKGTNSSSGSLIASNLYGTQIGATTTSRAGAHIELSDLEFNSDDANTLLDVDTIDVIIAVTNKSDEDLGVYFWNGTEITSNQATTSNIMSSYQNLNGVDGESVTHSNVAEAEYSFYHHIPSYYVIGSGTDANYAYGKYSDVAGKRYYTDYMHVYLRLLEAGLSTDELEIALTINLNVEKYIPTSTTVSEVSSAEGFTKIAKGITPTGYSSASTHVVLPYGLTSILASSFAYSSLSAISIPYGVTSIASDGLGYTMITSAVLPSTLTSLGSNAFQCSSLRRCYVPRGVTNISGCFCYAYSLITVDLPETLSTIGNDAFNECTGLSGIRIPSNVSTIGARAFKNTVITTIFIPSSVTAISGSTATESPFNFCSSSLVISCEASTKPAGWGNYWNFYSDDNALTTYWNQTR